MRGTGSNTGVNVGAWIPRAGVAFWAPAAVPLIFNGWTSRMSANRSGRSRAREPTSLHGFAAVRSWGPPQDPVQPSSFAAAN